MLSLNWWSLLSGVLNKEELIQCHSPVAQKKLIKWTPERHTDQIIIVTYLELMIRLLSARHLKQNGSLLNLVISKHLIIIVLCQWLVVLTWLVQVLVTQEWHGPKTPNVLTTPNTKVFNMMTMNLHQCLRKCSPKGVLVASLAFRESSRLWTTTVMANLTFRSSGKHCVISDLILVRKSAVISLTNLTLMEVVKLTMMSLCGQLHLI